eukprot:CAMPEP_0197415288 /NCGR_PEP_ID=MMETSP1170-20131217/1847_1 /TAXON_ID=54406 /ORGANISM="Sarcinochrysis sp, Strain CCMP770" /LENGTH=196 /DNA_ID=CAMNT_0042942069 /DNA_START=98 /DNA_END=684 /DNA_ORIENTATION=-
MAAGLDDGAGGVACERGEVAVVLGRTGVRRAVYTQGVKKTPTAMKRGGISEKRDERRNLNDQALARGETSRPALFDVPPGGKQGARLADGPLSVRGRMRRRLRAPYRLSLGVSGRELLGSEAADEEGRDMRGLGEAVQEEGDRGDERASDADRGEDVVRVVEAAVDAGRGDEDDERRGVPSAEANDGGGLGRVDER